MDADYNKQKLIIPNDWKVHRNEFYDIDPFGDAPEDDKDTYIYFQEDMIWLEKGDYTLDLGWYGEELNDTNTGYMLVLFRGKNWNSCELLELFRTISKSEITNSINQIIELINSDFYIDKTGYKIDENDSEYRYIGQHLKYSVSRNLNELLE